MEEFTMKVWLCTVPLIVLMAVSCENVGIPIHPEEATQILPLRVGNHWKYTYVVYDSAGVEKQRWAEQRSVVADTVVDGEVWYLTDFSSYLANRPDGVWQRMPNWTFTGTFLGLEDPQLFLPFPVSIGSSIKVSSIKTYTLLKRDVEVTVPAGTFSCYHYRMTLPGSIGGIGEYHLFYAPGVGLVKETWSIQQDPPPYSVISYYSGELLLSEIGLR